MHIIYRFYVHYVFIELNSCLICVSIFIDHWRDRLPTPVYLGFPCGSAGKESACNVGDLGPIPGLGKALFPWRRERLPTPVFWPGEFHGFYSPWSCRESDTNERLSLSLSQCSGSFIGNFVKCCLIMYSNSF